MIDSGNMFTIEHQELLEDELESYILHWDTRHWYRVITPKTPVAIQSESESDPISLLAGFLECLSPSVHTVKINERGRLRLVSSDYEDRPELCSKLKFSYCPFDSSSYPDSVKTIKFSELTEVDRLGAGLDMVTYQNDVETRVVFKYHLHRGPPASLWNETHVLAGLPPHPSLPSLDRLVLDDAETYVVGFTSGFIPTFSLRANPEQPFKLKWLKQLTEVVDLLNLEKGIHIGEILGNDILVHSETDDLVLLDCKQVVSSRTLDRTGVYDDVLGVMNTVYETLTGIESSSSTEDLAALVASGQLDLKRQFDCDVNEALAYLDGWAKKRREFNLNVKEVSPKVNRIEIYQLPGVPESQSEWKHVVEWQRAPYTETYPQSQDGQKQTSDNDHGDEDDEKSSP